MKRIIWHWTAGAYGVSSLEADHYHFIVDQHGRSTAGVFSPEDNAAPLKAGKYAAHTANANTGAIGVAVDAMAGAQDSPLRVGAYPITEAQIGIALPGGDFWGGNITDPRGLPSEIWHAAISRCDVPVDIEDGTEPMYRVGIEASLTQPPAATLEEILKAASATIADLGHGWGVNVGAPALPVYSFTDDDTIVTVKEERDPFPGLDDTWNAVTAKYPDPERFWETKEAPQRTNAAWESSDAFGRRAASLSLPACPYADQVQRLTLSWLEDERRFRKHSVNLPPASAHVELIDTVVWTSVHNGYDGKSFTVHEILEDPFTGIRQLSIREVDPNDWVVPPDYLLPTPPAPQPTTPVPSRPEGFEVLPLVIRDGAAAPRRFGIRIKWSPELEGSGMRWQARLAGGTDIAVHGTTQNVKAGQVDILAGLLPATDYEVQITLIADRITAPSGWLAVTTPDVRIGTDDLAADVVEIMEDAILAGILADASRQAAQTAEAGSVLARNLAQSAASEAGAARSAAQGAAAAALTSETAARSSETSAAGSATAASGSANTASGLADAAGVSATAAAASATSVGTHAGNAATSAAQAATSVTNAAGSASAAASSASTSAAILTDAQRALASASTVINGRASAATLPFGTTFAGAVAGYVVRPATEYGTDSEGDHLARSMAAAGAAVCLRAVVPSDADRVYRVTAKVKLTAANNVRLTASWLNADGSLLATGTYASTAVSAGGVTTLTMILGRQAGGLVTQVGGGTNWAAAAALRFSTQAVNAVAGANLQVYEILVDDLTQADQAARSATGAAGSASAAATSASTAAASQTAAGTSASAAQTAQTAAETARGQAQTHATNAATSATNAEGSANAAATSQGAAATSATSSGNSATAAATSAALASTKATEAGIYSAEALTHLNATARLTGGGVSKNPIFNLWSGSAPQEMQVVLGTGNAISRITTGVRYSSALQAYCSGTTDGPMVRLNRSINTLDCAVSPAGILIRAEIEYIGGNLANSGACLRALWIDTATRAEVRMLKDYIVATTGQVQVVEIYIPRPAAAVPGSATNFALDFFAGSTLGGATRASATFRLHRLDFEEVLANSQTSIYQRAVADLEGIQSAVIGLRAVAGSGGAVLELVATSGPTGSASVARISADNILMQGTVTADYLNVNWLVGGRISASYLDVDSLLTILPGAGLSYGKSSVASDETDGIYFGHDGGRFGLAASRTNAGKRQSLKLSSSTGLQLLNARHFVSGDAVPSQTIYTASTAGIINVPAGTSRMSFDLIGGGGGGGTRQISGGQSTWGYPGGATTVYVYDGATLRHSFVSAGGQEGRGINNNGGTVSTHGAAWGSGGKGGLSGYPGGYPAQGGWAAAAVVTDWIDLSGYASPRIRVVVGAGGLPGAGGAGWNSGDPGTPGRVVMSYSAARDVKADVVPLEPTATGSFVTGATGAGTFPNLGAGLWILHRNTAANGVGLGYVTLSPGTVVRAYQDGSSTLISSQTPTYTGGEASYTVFYAFYAMGSWG